MSEYLMTGLASRFVLALKVEVDAARPRPRLRIPLGEPSVGAVSGFVWLDLSESSSVSLNSVNILAGAGVTSATNAQTGAITVTAPAPQGRTVLATNTVAGVALAVFNASGREEGRWEASRTADGFRIRHLTVAGNVTEDRSYDLTAVDSVGTLHIPASARVGATAPDDVTAARDELTEDARGRMTMRRVDYGGVFIERGKCVLTNGVEVVRRKNLSFFGGDSWQRREWGGAAFTDDGRPTRTTWARGAWREHAYGERGLVVGTTYSDTDTPAVSYTYSDSGKVSTATLSDGTSYAYVDDDRLLNTNETVTIGANVFSLRRSHDDFRRAGTTLCVLEDRAYAACTRHYDAENRLGSTYPFAPVAGSLAVENAYDHRHRRVRKTVKSFNGSDWSVAETHVFVWDGNNIVLEKIAPSAGHSRVIEYFWGPDKSGTEQGAGGVGGLLAVSKNGVFHIPCYDHNGNIVCYLSETGAFSAEYVYIPPVNQTYHFDIEVHLSSYKCACCSE